MRSARRLAVLGALVMLVGACGGDTTTTTDGTTTAASTITAPETTTTGAEASTTTENALTDVTVRTAFRFNAYDMPFSVGIAKGFYEDAGLNVTLAQGEGSSSTIQTVASGADDFGGADASAGVLAISNEDVPIKYLSVLLQKTPQGFIHTPGADWSDPESLRDMILVSSAGSAELTVLPAILQQYDMTMDDIGEVRLVDFQSRIPVFLETGDEGVIIGFATGDLIRARSQNPDLLYDSWANYGVQVFSIGIITNTSMIENNPDIVRAFVEGTTRGYQYALDNPEEAVSLSVEMVEDVDEELLREGLKVIIEGEEYQTDRSAGMVVGTTDDADWVSMLELYESLGSIETVKPTSEYYTNEFVPSN